MTDILARAEAAHALRWEQPGPNYPEPVPTGLVWLGDWASEELPELVAELKAARAQRDEWRAQSEHAVAKWEELEEELHKGQGATP